MVVHKCTYTLEVYEWDRRKAEKNRLKHGIDFADATTVFDDEAAITIDDDNAAELRHVTIGSDLFGRVLVVVYTWREEKIRIISTRRAEPRERRTYEGLDR